MKKNHEHHSSKKHGHKHHHHVDLEEQKVVLGSETYVWKGNDRDYFQHTKWYRISKNWVLRDREKVHFVKEKDRDEIDEDDGSEIEWKDFKYRLKDRMLIRRLDRLVEREEHRQERHEQEAEEKERLRNSIIEQKGARLVEPEAKPEEPRQKPSKQSSDGGEIKHTKHGVRLFSNDAKHYFNIAVFKSTKYPGCASVQLSVAGGWYNYTLDSRNMKAFREEVARGGN